MQWALLAFAMPPYTVLILKADPISTARLRYHALVAYPTARCQVVHPMAHARTALSETDTDLFVTGTRAMDGEVLDFALELSRNRSRAGKGVGGHPLSRAPFDRGAARGFRRRDISFSDGRGIQSGTGDDECFRERRLLESTRATDTGLPRRGATATSVPHPDRAASHLRARRWEDDEKGGRLLGMKPSSVHSVRRSIYATFRVHNRADFIPAVEHGSFA